MTGIIRLLRGFGYIIALLVLAIHPAENQSYQVIIGGEGMKGCTVNKAWRS
jgi:hypothetical protein